LIKILPIFWLIALKTKVNFIITWPVIAVK
jgi:hypothetical protein